MDDAEIFGFNSFRLFEGDKAENLEYDVDCEWDSLTAVDEIDAADPVDVLRRPANDSESRFPFLDRMLEVDAAFETWRGTLDTGGGEDLVECCLKRPLG